VGRLHEDKGVLELAAAFARVALDHPDVALMLVGDGPARAAVEAALAPLADQLGGSVQDVAAGYHQIAVTHMGTAIAKVSLGRGYDPRDFMVLGYGGGSGLFLAEVCSELGIKRLVMPRAAATSVPCSGSCSSSVGSIVRHKATASPWRPAAP